MVTEAGKAFLAEARQPLLRADRAVEVARQVAQGESGRLKVGFSGFATYSLLGSCLNPQHSQDRGCLHRAQRLHFGGRTGGSLAAR